MLAVTATSDRPAGRSLSWQPRRFTAVLLLASTLISLWLFTPVFWDRLGGDSRAFYAAARVDLRGGDPYSFPQLTAEEAAIDAAAGGHTGTSAYGANPYHYPPLMTRAWATLTPLGDRGFYWVNFGFLLLMGLLGFELILAALSWSNRWLARGFFVVSPAMALVLVSGNPSTLLLAAWGGALLAASRNRALLTGSVLAVGWIKPPVGIPVALAILLAGPASRRLVAAGFALGTAAFATANVLVGGPSATFRWLGSLFEFTATLNPKQAAVIGQCCLTGLPAVLLDHVSMPVAVLAAAVIAGCVLLFAFQRGLLAARSPDPLLPLALLTSLALVVTPYVHLNDLVLEALPLLVIASQPLTLVSRPVLTLWGLGASAPLALSFLSASLNLPTLPSSVAGFGLLLAILTPLALVAGIRAQGEQVASRAPNAT
jgi:Glycosyltransferase family 87